jgi:LytS/YehU family sensor histidine kinase
MFNALNNIYSLSYTGSAKAPVSILKLSEMLRYVLDDCSKDNVPLSSEINYIENYITFQKLKSGHEQNISFYHQEITNEVEISPMLLIPFIENSFKYSRVEDDLDAWVKLSIEYKPHQILFSIENSIPATGKPASGSGMGIKNVNNRLDLLYPYKYHMDIRENNNSYLINLKLDI